MKKLLFISTFLCLLCFKSIGQLSPGSNTSIYEDYVNGVRISYPGYNNGYVRITSDSWLNFYTDRQKFYFNKEVTFNNGISAYNSNNFKLTMSQGYVQFTTDSWLNFWTDRSAFYFNKPIISNDGTFNTYSTSDLKLQTNGTTRLTILNSSGNVGIGTATTGDHRLAVEGSIGAREVTIGTTSWADFVFEKEYDLLTLEEVEAHIEEKGHLPEIPSEAEVMEDGIKVGEMNAKLLQKIEELTLYLIEQNKHIQVQQNRIEQLEKKVSDIEK